MYKKLAIIFVLIISCEHIFSQEIFNTVAVTDTLPVNIQNQYSISSLAIVPFSETINIGSKLLKSSDYNISYRLGEFSLSDTLFYSVFDTIYISYRSVLTNLKKEYKRRSLVMRFDEKLSDTVRFIKLESSPITAESIFGEGIRSSGSLVRGFDVSTNKDFTINSGLRLQLNGKLSDDLEIVAALTDENTPIQPEGNTETLEELDKVFIEVKHPNVTATFGDYDLQQSSGEFGKVNRKLQGFKATSNINGNNIMFAVAGARGKFNTYHIDGTDGNQGPYRLFGPNNEKEIIIIAGSEKVFVDGKRMKRGENSDYTIEYGNAELTFTSNRLITSASRIIVDFEYTDRNYNRNFAAAGYNRNFYDDKLTVAFKYFRESDNENNPVDILLSEEDKRILEEAGDDRLKAAKSGVAKVVPDSAGIRTGVYTRVDTVLEGEEFAYYIYAPGAEESEYKVDFSFVGEGIGNYIKMGTGNYKFVGLNKGSYLPVTFLPTPEDKHLGVFLVSARPVKNLNLKFELAGSVWDRNKFSEKDHSDNYGYARNIVVDYLPVETSILSANLGKVGFNYRERFVEKTFSTMDRINTIEFNRDYNLNTASKGSEVLREASVFLSPVEQLSVNGLYGFLKKGEKFNSNRILTTLQLNEPNNYRADFKLDYVNTKDVVQQSYWMKQEGTISYALGKIIPGIDYLFENKKDKMINSNSLLSSSLKYLEVGPKFEVLRIGGINFTAKYSIREESFPLDGELKTESHSTSQVYQIEYSGAKEFRTTLGMTLRDKNVTEDFKKEGFLDNETFLIRNHSKFNFWNNFITGDLYYDAATKKTSKLEKVFIRVQPGKGNYIYLGDINNNEVADENEFAQTAFDGNYILTTLPTDELFPIIELKFNTRWRIKFGEIFRKNSFLTSILNPLSTETNFRIEENSEEKNLDKIIFLNLSNFLNDSTTIRGSQLFQHDLHLFKNKRNFSMRFRYLERKQLNQFSTGLETGYFSERGIRFRFKMVKEINNQTEYINKTDNVISESNPARSRLVSSDEITSDFSYRPINKLEFGFKIGVRRSTDNLPDKPTIIDNNLIAIRFTLSFAGRGRIRLEAERDELLAENSENNIPYEILLGKTIGKNYTWRLNFDYKFASLLQTNLSYNGRVQGSGNVVHNLSAAARAYF